MRLVNTVVKEDFTVTDSEGNAVTGLTDSDFTKKLYDPTGNEVSSSILVTVTELGSGNYRASFTPDKAGDWYLVVYNSTYFPWGKANTIVVEEADFGTILMYHANKKALYRAGNSHYIERIYDSSGVTVVKEFDITVSGATELRVPV